MNAVIIEDEFHSREFLKNVLAELLTQQNDTIRQQKKEIELVNRKLEMKVLQGQMNPHFIFNSLNAIQYFVSLDQKRNAMAYLSAFARFMRQLLQNAYTPVRQEALMLEQYLALKKMLHTTDLKNADNSAAGTRLVIQFPMRIWED